MDYKKILLDTNKYIDNEYCNSYIKLINKKIAKSDLGTHKHHIIPFHLLKLQNIKRDDINYIVSLKISDHIIAHYLLFKCAATNSEKNANVNALNLLINKKYDSKYFSNLTIKEIELLAEGRNCLKTNLKQVNGEKNKGKIYINNGINLKKIYPDDLNKWIEKGWVKGGLPFSEEHVQKLRKKKPMSDEAKKRLKGRGAGKIIIHLNGKYKHINKEDLAEWEMKGWIKGGRKHTIEEREKLSKLNKGKHISEEHKNILKHKYKGYITMHKDNKEKHVYPSDYNFYKLEGWEEGRAQIIKDKIKFNHR